MHRADNTDYRPLLPLLAGFTIVTGFVDAVSYLKFGHVFVANMTGNIVFLGFAAAGAADISMGGSLLALAGFLAGAALGGYFVRRHGEHRKRLLLLSAGTKVILIGGACGIAFAAAPSLTAPLIIPLLGISMGVQNTLARKVAVPDVTTTVLTMTITGIAADAWMGADAASRQVRRVSSVITMFAGALAGAFIVLQHGVGVALLCATLIVLAIFVRACTLREVEN